MKTQFFFFNIQEDDKSDTDNRADQLNPNNDAYHSSRDHDDDSEN
jgi:hypothetical protein